MRIHLLFLALFLFVAGGTPAQNRSLNTQPDPDRERLLRMAESFDQRFLLRRAELERVAREKGWTLREETNEGVTEIQFIDERGFPQAYRTTNLNAGRTTNTDDIWVGGSTGLNLTGSGYVVGEWDGGGVLTTHQEFDNGAGTRVTQVDGPVASHYHSTHVAGTIIAEGQVAAAHGMATQALLNAYEWTNDVAEMTTAAANGLTLSNHSYGWNRGWNSSGGNMYWWGDPSVSATEDYLFGFYDASSQAWDQIAYNAPNYLIVKSSGNDRNDAYTGSHYVYNGASWVLSNAVRDPDGGADGYDCIEQQGVAKNILTIGAVNDIPAGWSSSASVVQSAFSSWGPTDDGRIKPDLVANGVGVYSTTNTGNTDYTTLDGTSMATPNTTGTLVLLQSYYQSLRGGTMSAAALKGLVINTANEAGPANGPDYQNGWGLLNASGAAALITADNTQGGRIVQGILVNGQTTDYTYYCDGTTNVNVTLSWTDPAGTPPAASLNPTALMLVNDLDMRLIGSTTTNPWVLNPASPSTAASKSDNFRDNVETINLLSPAAGYYTIRITHKGALSGGQQAYALIVNGMRTAPTGTYCAARSTSWASFEFISKVVMGSISNTTGRSPGGYHDYTGMVNKLVKGATQSLSVTINGYASDYGRVWIDWNQDGYFTGAGEEYVLGSGAGPVYSINITAPMNAVVGFTAMRVRLGYSVAPTACGTTGYGETEDYTIQVQSGCDAGGGCDEYISRVQAGSIDNSTGCSGYADYTATHSTSLPVNGIVHVTVTNGVSLYSADQCGIWVDWNRNGSFLDAGEQVTVTGTPGSGPYAAAVVPPSGQTTGIVTMRVRITYTGAVGPCGSTTYGEVEDYTLNLTAQVPNQWVGNISNDWFDPLNWSLEHIPATTEDVTISTGYLYYPIIGSGVGVCNNLTVGSGARISVGNGDLSIAGNMDIYGQAEETSVNSDFVVGGNILWQSGSTANILAGEFWVTGNWEFRSGANANLANGIVVFDGATASNIRNYTAACSFASIYNYKSSGGYVNFSGMSTDTTKINGNLVNFYTSSLTESYSSYPVVLKGGFTNSGNLQCVYGTFIFNGTSHTINLNTGDFFNHLVINSSGSTSLADSLRVHGNLTIRSGSLAAGAFPIIIEGNWTNQVGPAGFDEGTGKVVFDGPGHQYVLSDETFNILEASMGAALRVASVSHTVSCNQYLWTSGGIDVLAGTFTALDLVQNGLYGGFWLNPNGTINLYNNDGWVDLNGEIHIYGGNFNVYGGNGSASFWPYAANGIIEMNAGTLDFKNTGILVYNTGTYSLTENITGGTIRTAGSFLVNRADYTPSGGTTELYGATDAGVETTNGGYLYHLIINKGVADGSSIPGPAMVRDRFTGWVTDAPASNTVGATNLLDVNGNMLIQSGIFNAGLQTIQVAGNWTNLAGTGGFLEGTSTVVFDGADWKSVTTPEDFYNLTLNKTYPSAGALVLTGNCNVANDLTASDGAFTLSSSVSLNVDGNLTIAVNGALSANPGSVISVAKNWFDGNTTAYSANHGFNPVECTVIFDGNADQFVTAANPSEMFYHLVINKASGKFRSNNNAHCFGNVTITSGTWEDNVAGLDHQIFGNFTTGASGVFNTTTMANTVTFTGLQHSILTYNGASGSLRNIEVFKGIGFSVMQAGNINLPSGGNLTIHQGYYILSGNQLSVSGDVAVNNAGYLYMGAGSTLVMTDARSISINAGGRFEGIATISNPAIVRANVGSARYNFNINSGGTISTNYCLFRNMGTAGVNVTAGGFVDVANAFFGCGFQDGAIGGTLLTIDNGQVLTIRNAIFPANTWSGTSNVSKNVNAGQVYFVDYTGGFSGESFDNDPNNRVSWVPALTASASATPPSICAGSSSQLNTTVTGGLAPYGYQWSPGTGLSGTTLANPVATPNTSRTYSVTVTDALGTTATGNVTVTVTPVLPVSVSIAASANPSPPGNFVMFTATPVNGGSLPSYQWKVNGVNAGTGLPTYSYVPNNHDQVSCVLTSNYACPSGNPATSNVITMAVLNPANTVTGTVPAPLTLCFDASNTVTVAGGGNTFIVQSGAGATMIAGQKISYLPGTRVFPGGYMHGYITTTNQYCGAVPPASPVTVAGGNDAGEMDPGFVDSPWFALYPNPTSGRFTLAQKAGDGNGMLQVEMMDMRGSRILSEQMKGERSHVFDVTGLPAGIYLVRVVKDDHVETFKLVLSR